MDWKLLAAQVDHDRRNSENQNCHSMNLGFQFKWFHCNLLLINRLLWINLIDKYYSYQDQEIKRIWIKQICKAQRNWK